MLSRSNLLNRMRFESSDERLINDARSQVGSAIALSRVADCDCVALLSVSLVCRRQGSLQERLAKLYMIANLSCNEP